MTPDRIRETTREFIKKNFIFDENRTLGEDESLLGSGIVDSTGILELIAFLEDTYRLKFGDDELVGENFDSVAQITSFVEKKLSQKENN